MTKKHDIFALFSLLILFTTTCFSQDKTTPVFENGEAQIVEGFSDYKEWIRHDLWVETTFNTDGDDKLDRMHVSVTRPKQTDTEGLKLPVIYVSSPYFAGVAPDVAGIMWNVEHELAADRHKRHTLGPARNYLIELKACGLIT